jgi:hypothetical protein
MNVRRDREDGAVLIIAIGILALLAVLGTTFANLMRLERQATQNYIRAQEVDLVNDAAVDQVIALLHGAESWYSFTSYKAPWLYKIMKGENSGELAHGLLPLDSDRAGDWTVIARQKKFVSRYRTKVIDTSSQININGRQDTLGRMLENLARAIIASPRLHQPNNPLYSGPHQSGNLIKGEQIIQFRNRLEGHRFHSKTQLRELIGQENFEILNDFITVESYVDPFTYKPFDGLNEIVEAGELRGGASGGGLGGSGRVSQTPVEFLASQVSAEPRSPINVNTAPEEVLIACLQGVAARQPFPYSQLNYAPIDEGATVTGQRVPGKEERDIANPRGVWIYSDETGKGLPFEFARGIAQQIIARRKTEPFRCWTTGDRAIPGGFYEFIYSLTDSAFPSPNQARVMDPLLPLDRRIDAEIKGGSPTMSRLWNKGHSLEERELRRSAGMSFHTHHAFYYDLMKSAILANANPNTRINRYNPNVPGYMAVDKSDLVRLDDRDKQTARKAHTTDFCFDTNGVFEVTSLGEIAESIAPATPGNPEVFRPVYQRPVRTVVKVFDVLRHTSQFHFERTFNTGDRSSRNNRRYVVTFPDPMQALTDALSQGSFRDGNIQMVGQSDGRRLLAPPTARPQMYKTPEAIVCALGLMDRDETSYAKLRKYNRGSKQYIEEIVKVLNANYSRSSMGENGFNTIYSRDELLTLGYGDPAAINKWPAVDTEEYGTDLYPDGFLQGLFNTTHVGGTFIHLPAHMMMGPRFRGNEGKGNRARQVGAAGVGYRGKEVVGNVPYYQGGIAFWTKFQFNGDDPVFSGLIGCTQVAEDVPLSASDFQGSEGTQFYIFKNTEGYLRVVRMYYHQAFQDTTGEDAGTGAEGGIRLWPDDSGSSGGDSGSSGSENPIIKYLDPKKMVARADYIVDVRKFRAHEWHHIAVDWNDAAPAAALMVYIDFERVQGGLALPQPQSGESPSSWTRLNVKRPRDELFIGGFIRNQKVADSGVFKWYTNTIGGTGAAGGGFSVIDRPLKKILANATIDEVITYTGTFPGVRNYYGAGAPGYFTNQQGEYANVFEVPLPPEVDYVVLRSFDWTSYYPTFFTTRDNAPIKVVTPPITCQLFPGRDNIPQFFEPWRQSMRNVPSPVANRLLTRRETKGLIGRNADMVYDFKMSAGKINAGKLAGGSVQTPIIDDVTLTYYLPDPKILLQEDAE